MINRIVALSLSLVILVLLCQRAIAQDFVPGEVPGQQEVAELEKQAAAKPGDFHLARKLGKAYFFQVFGEGRKSSIEKSARWLERALEIKADDAETIAYLGAMTAIMAREKRDLGLLNRAIELSKRAEDLAPDDVAVLSVTGVTFLNLPETLGLTARALESMEKVRKRMGPTFSRMSHHGQQRVLLTEGQAYVKLKQIEKARECFEQALKINQESVEAALIKAELEKLKARS